MITVHNKDKLNNSYTEIELTAPLYWWLDFVQSVETGYFSYRNVIEKVVSKELTVEDFSYEGMLNPGPLCDSTACLHYTISRLNFWISRYNDLEERRKNYFDYNGYQMHYSKEDCEVQIRKLLPCNYNYRKKVLLTKEDIYVIKEDYEKKYLTGNEWDMFIKYLEGEFLYGR